MRKHYQEISGNNKALRHSQLSHSIELSEIDSFFPLKQIHADVVEINRQFFLAYVLSFSLFNM